MKEFEFIEINEPDGYCLENFHKALAKGLINKYGEEAMRKVVDTIKENKINY